MTIENFRCEKVKEQREGEKERKRERARETYIKRKNLDTN